VAGARVVGSYERLRPLGRGTTVESWLARARWDDGDLRTVVVESIDQSNEMAERFLHEAHKLARLNHPDLAQVFDVGRLDGRCYLARQHLPGPSLREIHGRCRARGAMIPGWLLARIGTQIGDALQYARSNGASDGHQWVTPDQVTLSVFGACTVVLGRGGAEGEGVCDGNGIAPCRCDVISLGATLYELLTDAPLFSRSAVNQCNTFRGVASGGWPELEAVVTRAMALTPDAIAAPGEIARLCSNLEDGRGPAEAGMFVASLFPDRLDRGFEELAAQRFWDRLATFDVTREEQRWTEPKLNRAFERPAPGPVSAETDRGSWIGRLLAPTLRFALTDSPRMSSEAATAEPPAGQTAAPAAAAPAEPAPTDPIAAMWERAGSRPGSRGQTAEIWDRARPAAWTSRARTEENPAEQTAPDDGGDT